MTSEVTVPSIVTKDTGRDHFEVLATTLTTDRQRRQVYISAWSGADAILSVSVSDPDHPTLGMGADGKGLVVGEPVKLFGVSVPYTGPGEYEIYRNLWERMIVVIQ